MASEQHERICELFLAAVELPPERRESYLDQVCGADEALRAELASLLAHDDSSVAERAGGAVARGLRELEQAADVLPESIGGYLILRCIGRGGMGIVYEAEQTEPRRRVALKVIRPGFVTPSNLRRFRDEAQVLGWLDHPHIARVYGAGTDERGAGPQPYFAMELVEGEPLTRHCEREGLDIEARLELLAQVCDAVHHAHQKGVIHRDLKPANILVDREGRPKILDFGVARVTESDLHTTTLHTQAGELVGTLSYMSPEQVEADPSKLDIRSDVYALGVVAYELLSGRLPHDLHDRALHEAARAIAEDEPSRLGALDARLRGDVETIVARAIEKDRTRRYASAEELASDLRRFLADEPIAARPASAVYQLRKFARRNRVLVGGIAAVFVTLVAGVVVSARFGLREARANAERGAALEQAERQTRIAREVNHFLTDGLLGAVDPLRTPDPEIQMRRVIDMARPNLVGRFEDEPLVKAGILETLGVTYRSLGVLDSAEACLDEALELRRAAPAEEAPGDAELDRLELERARVLNLQARWDEAAELLVGLRERLLADPDASLTDRATATNLLASVRTSQADFAAAEELLEWSLAADLPVEGRPSETRLIALRNLGLVCTHLDRFDEAEAAYRSVLEQTERRYGADDLRTALAAGDLAASLFQQSRFDEALGLFTAAIPVERRVLGDGHPDTLVALDNLALVYGGMGRYAEAEPLLREVLQAQRARFGEDNPKTLLARSNLGGHLVQVGRNAEALEELIDVYARQTEVLGSDHVETLETANSLAVAYGRNGDLAAATNVTLEALEARRRVSGEGHQGTLAALSQLADLYERQGRMDAAEKYHLLAIDAARKHLPEGHLFRGVFPLRYARYLITALRYEEAEELGLEAHGYLEQHFGAEHTWTQQAVLLVTNVYLAAGKTEEVRAWRDAHTQ